jgi:hypothetical protein
MNVWERHGIVEFPFYALAIALRRSAEAARLHYWRRVFGWSIGRGVRVHWSVQIPRLIDVRLGDGAVIGRDTRVVAEVKGGALHVGANTNIDRNCLLDASGHLVIGANSTISESVTIFTHSHGRDPRKVPSAFDLVIGDGVWICMYGMVLSSAKSVGAGAIIGPHEVVRKPVPAGGTVATRERIEIEHGEIASMPGGLGQR